ncbi:MAG: glycerophosphoryl diester phosphodiesterase [Saprospiraceae bacterium]|jgi:glycerophosphoryl diester phosphodiesterase
MKRIIIFCFIFSIIISCEKEEFNILNLNGNRITVLGHAGMGISSTYPMNSYESILRCLNLGTDGTEFDVQMTKDSVLVAYHNRDLSDATNLNGLINSLNWNEVRNAHYTQTPYLDYSIISLEQLFANIDNIQKYKFTFDCKLYNNNNNNQFFESYTNAVVNLIQKYQIENNIYVESQSVEFLTLFKNKKPNYIFFIYPSSFESGLDIALSLGLSGITISTRNITKEQIKNAHDNNLLVAIWNTHTKSDNIEAINKNPDFIQTDKVKNLIKLLK